jgi:hypothetical protein
MGFPLATVGLIAALPTSVIVGTYHGGVFQTSNNGGSWVTMNTGLGSSFIQMVVPINNDLYTSISNVGPGGFPLRGGVLFRSENGGVDWIPLHSELNRRVTYSLVSTDSLLFAGTDSGAFVSSDRGNSWRHSGLSQTWVTELSHLGATLFAVTRFGLFRSTDYGLNWVPVNTGLSSLSIRSVVGNGANVFASTCRDNAQQPGGVFRSTNNGESWMPADTGLSDPSGCVLTMSGTKLFAGSSGISFSNDDGAHWSAMNEGLPTSNIVESLVAAGETLFTTYGGTVYAWHPNESCWACGDEGSQVAYSCLAIIDANLFATVAYPSLFGPIPDGIWRRPLSELIASAGRPTFQTPSLFSLFQNYPNPFNPSTTIRYTLPRSSFITLTVYNTLGQQVAQLVNEQQQAGYHNAVFRGDGLASGVYFYRLEAGSFVSVKKLLLLK